MARKVSCECLDPLVLAFKDISDLATGAVHLGEGWDIDRIISSLNTQLRRIKHECSVKDDTVNVIKFLIDSYKKNIRQGDWKRAVDDTNEMAIQLVGLTMDICVD